MSMKKVSLLLVSMIPIPLVWVHMLYEMWSMVHWYYIVELVIAAVVGNFFARKYLNMKAD